MPIHINNTRCMDCSFRSLIFDKVDSDELEQLNAHKNEYIFHKGEKIVEEGNATKRFVYLKRGLVKLSKKSENNKAQIISVSKPKNFIGFLDVFSREQYQYSITAVSNTEVCFINAEVIKKIIGQNGQFALKVLSKICHVSDEIIFNRVNICSKQMRGRIAFLLLYLAREIFDSGDFQLPLTRREIGELIAMSTENVIRILSEFKREGILRMDGKNICIADPHQLELISKVS